MFRMRRLCEGYCQRCQKEVEAQAVEYSYDSPEHYDGVSEYRCGRCGRREGRWTDAVLTGDSTEPRLGEEKDSKIHEEEAMRPTGSQPR